MGPEFFMGEKEEKARYETHNNDVNDKGYQNFVMPLVDKVLEDYKPNSLGLDFGCGSGPVIAKLLREQDYLVNLYDPYFANIAENLNLKYDYIIACEVIEHFYNPNKEFVLLRSLLSEEGSLYLKTDLIDENFDFQSWYYKNDPSHVFFYSKESLRWIKEEFSFKTLIISDRHIKLSLKT